MTMPRVNIFLLLCTLLQQFCFHYFSSFCLWRYLGFGNFCPFPSKWFIWFFSPLIYNGYAYPQHSPSVEPPLPFLRNYVSMVVMQVRFHPLHPEILASGSLDHEVHLWDANTAECLGHRDFCNFFCALLSFSRCDYIPLSAFWIHLIGFCIYSMLQADRPIASIAFHAQGELLAVASGHKVRLVWLRNLV